MAHTLSLTLFTLEALCYNEHQHHHGQDVQGKSMSSAEIERLLNVGRSVAEAGHWEMARRYFAQVLSIDPANEEALLWQAGLADDPRESIAYLKQVLRINPGNERAEAGLRWAQSRLPRDERRRLQASQPPAQARRKKRRSTSLYLLSVLLMICVLVCLALSVFTVTNNIDALRAFLFPPTITPTATSTSTSTATATATCTSTPTSTPTATPTSTPTPTLTPTPSPTWTPLPTAIPPTPEPVRGVKWVDIDISTQTLIAYEGDVEILRTTVSTGAARTPTVTGRFRIFRKLVSQTMIGPDYVQPNVPYVMYFYGAYSIHGTYWHNDFGRPRSHGCVNLRTADARWLFDWTDPPLAPGLSEVWDTVSGTGTLVVIHE